MKYVTIFSILIFTMSFANAEVCKPRSDGVLTCQNSYELTEATLILNPQYVKSQDSVMALSQLSGLGACKALGFQNIVGEDFRQVEKLLNLARINDQGIFEGSDPGGSFISSITCQ
jgi:hypothetical protein